MKAMGKCSTTAPSTNRPIVCPACEPELADAAHLPPDVQQTKKYKPTVRPAVWSYNMRAHWQRHHETSEMPAALAGAISLLPGESEALKKRL